MKLSDPVDVLSGVGKKISSDLKKLQIKTVNDLLFFIPNRYVDYSEVKQIKSIKSGDVISLQVVVKSIGSKFIPGKFRICEALVTDETGVLKVVWFNQSYLATALPKGTKVLLSGKIVDKTGLQMQNPMYEKISEQSDNTIHTAMIVPIYPKEDKIPSRIIRKLVLQSRPYISLIKDKLPNDILQKFNILSIHQALQSIHFPNTQDDILNSRFRFGFDAIFLEKLAKGIYKSELEKAMGPKIKPDLALVKKLIATLPFQITDDQKKSVWQIMQNFENSAPMNRLLIGDVGSGKTLVAMVASLLVAKSKKCVFILCPTQILAQQHHKNFQEILSQFQINIALATQSQFMLNQNEVSKVQFEQEISSGSINIVIGTQAIFKYSEATDLGLVVIDEQHRFGVGQRQLLLKNKTKPHLLTMTATPIPRSLALAIYDDLDVSIINQKPQGRAKISTKVVTTQERNEVYVKVKKELSSGRQAFVVTPRLEENPEDEIKSAKSELIKLKQKFPKFEIALMHGKLKATEKEQVMTDFLNKKYHVLVSTTVIEVGIDVLNATVMIIENGERFGLAQLHQLRGRVGRSRYESFCYIFSDSEDEKSLDRLKRFETIGDGFKLSQIDLKNRGFGKLYGLDQSGFDWQFRKFVTTKTFTTASAVAKTTLSYYPNLRKMPDLKKLIKPIIDQMHLE